jgi:hypothetical protein
MHVFSPRGITVVVTSNYSPDQLLDGLPEQRKEAVKRRFTMIEIRWMMSGNKKIGRIVRYQPGGTYIPPPPWQGWETVEELQ